MLTSLRQKFLWQIIFFESCIFLKTDRKIQIELLIIEIKAVTKIFCLSDVIKRDFLSPIFSMRINHSFVYTCNTQNEKDIEELDLNLVFIIYFPSCREFSRNAFCTKFMSSMFPILYQYNSSHNFNSKSHVIYIIVLFHASHQ